MATSLSFISISNHTWLWNPTVFGSFYFPPLSQASVFLHSIDTLLYSGFSHSLLQVVYPITDILQLLRWYQCLFPVLHCRLCHVMFVLVVNMFLSSAVLRNSCQIWQVFHNPNSAYSDSVGKELVMLCTCNRKAWCKMHKRQFGLPWLFRNVGL